MEVVELLCTWLSSTILIQKTKLITIIETLLEHGADVNCEDEVLHWRPLRLAEEIRAWHVVDKLLEKQADSKDLVLIKTDIEKQLHIQDPVEVFRKEGDVNYIGNLPAETMYTALSEGYENLVEFILNCGVSARHYIYHKHMVSMLHVAAEQGQLRLVQLLIEQGAYIDDRTCWYNRTPLMQAALHGHVQVAELLVNHGASVNARDIDGETALLMGVSMGQNEIVKLLLQTGADAEVSGGKYNRTPLMEAAVGGHVQIVELLINHGTSVNVRDKDGNTALSLALTNKHNNIAQLLLQHGAQK